MGKMNFAGRVFQRIYRDRKGGLQKTSTWFLKYQVGGKPVIISTGTQDYEEALLMLRRKMAQAAQLRRSEGSRVSVDQLLDLVIEDYRSNRRHTTYDVEHRVTKHLRPFFGTKRPFEITAGLLEQYVESRAGNAAPATVNKELAYLRRAFRLGYRHEPQLVEAVPVIRMLSISKRQTLEHDVLMSEQLVRRLESQIRAEDQQPSESDTVLDNNGESR
jgi:hypothetical protein